MALLRPAFAAHEGHPLLLIVGFLQPVDTLPEEILLRQGFLAEIRLAKIALRFNLR